jgi:hypothetical protein
MVIGLLDDTDAACYTVKELDVNALLYHSDEYFTQRYAEIHWTRRIQ